MLGGVPTPLDPLEMRRLLFTLTLLSSLSNASVVPPEPATVTTRVVAAGRGRPASGRRHVRPPRSC